RPRPRRRPPPPQRPPTPAPPPRRRRRAPGSPRGGRGGQVVDIIVRYDPRDASLRIPVYEELDPDRIQQTDGAANPQQSIQRLVDQGLRARLQIQSFVTGLLYIELNFYPGTEIKLVGSDIPYPELPSIRSTFNELSRTLDKLPLEQLVVDASSTVEAVNRLVSGPEVPALLRRADALLADLRALLTTVEGRVGGVMDRAEAALGAGEATLDAYRGLADTLTDRAQGLAAELTTAVAAVETTLEGIQGAVAAAEATARQGQQTLATVEDSLDGVLSRETPLGYRLAVALDDFAAAATALRNLADYLERHPNALIYGKRR
ncbi:MAG: hypothetical protein ACFCBW_18780, partial [Candidatus Competibacterales bacterium]